MPDVAYIQIAPDVPNLSYDPTTNTAKRASALTLGQSRRGMWLGRQSGTIATQREALF